MKLTVKGKYLGIVTTRTTIFLVLKTKSKVFIVWSPALNIIGCLMNISFCWIITLPKENHIHLYQPNRYKY